jgi:hypothetical protein
MYRQINGFAKVELVMVFSVEGATNIYWQINGFARVEFIEVF